MNSDVKAKWVAALRGGNYKQTRQCLRKNENSFCCLGVLCDILHPEGWSSREVDDEDIYTFTYKTDFRLGSLPIDLLKEVNLDEFEEQHLIELNDDGTSFSDIASYIEEKL